MYLTVEEDAYTCLIFVCFSVPPLLLFAIIEEIFNILILLLLPLNFFSI